MELLSNLMDMLGVGLFAAFSWMVVVCAIQQKKIYDETGKVVEAVIINKKSFRRNIGRFSETVYNLDVKTFDGKKYNIVTDAYRVRRYKENQKISIIVTDQTTSSQVGSYNQAILKIDKDSSVLIIIALIITVATTIVFLMGVIYCFIER